MGRRGPLTVGHFPCGFKIIGAISVDPDIEALAKSAIEELNSKLTDEVFLIIQNDRRLMKTYLSLVEEHGVSTVNRRIGKIVKHAYDLTNTLATESQPKSTLILSHQIFE